MTHQNKKVLHWDDERSSGDGFMVTTAYGWAFDPDEDENTASHVRGFDTAKEARAALKWVEPCKCARCERRANG